VACVEDLPYEVVLSTAPFAECREFIEKHCARYCHVNPGFRLFDKYMIGAPPIVIGVDGDVVVFPFTKLCYGTFLLQIEDAAEAAWLGPYAAKTETGKDLSSCGRWPHCGNRVIPVEESSGRAPSSVHSTANPLRVDRVLRATRDSGGSEAIPGQVGSPFACGPSRWLYRRPNDNYYSMPRALYLVLLLLLTLPAVVGAVPIKAPAVITSPGTYVIEEDLLASEAGICLEVRASNVVIEGNGHRLQGRGTPNTQGIRIQGVSGVQVRNIDLDRWDQGLWAVDATGLEVEDVVAADNLAAGVLITGNGAGSRLANVTAHRNRDGIMLASTAGLRLEGLTASHNREAGFALHAATACLVTGSVANANGRAGLLLVGGDGCSFQDNSFANRVNVAVEGTAPSNTWASGPGAGPNIVGGPQAGGNFWGSLDGTGFSETTPDTNGDGFCDVTYLVQTLGIRDQYPLHLPAAPRVITGPNKVTITAGGTYLIGADLVADLPMAIEVLADHVVIEGRGHLLEGPGLGGGQGACGIYVNGATDVTVRDLRLRNWVYGVYYDHSPDGRIEDITATNSSFASLVVSTGSDRCVVTDSTISGNACGLYLASVSDGLIWNNRFANIDDVRFGGVYSSHRWNVTPQTGRNAVGGPTIGGNWWEGVSESLPDEDHDGIGDVPVALGLGNIDAAPLVHHTPGTPPEPAFAFEPHSGPAPLRVQFTDTSMNLGPLADCTWTWQFGDGASATARNPAHTFVQSGTYRVDLAVKSRFGNANHTEYLGVGVGTPLAAALDSTLVFETEGSAGWFGAVDPSAVGGASARSGFVSENKTSAIQARVTGPYRLSFSWRCSGGPGDRLVFLVDGVPEQALEGDTGWRTATRTVPAGSHVLRWEYCKDGAGTAGDDAGYLDCVQPGIGPRAAFEASPRVGTAPLDVVFVDRSSGAPTDWQWEFGDGESAGGRAMTTHTFYEPGTYAVALTVSNTDGYDTNRTAAYITVLPPLAASFTVDPAEGRSPLVVRFTDTSTGEPTNWRWEFGDGQVLDGPYPAATHAYVQPGSYDARLTVSKANATGSIATRKVHALPASPSSVDFTADTTTGYAPFEVRFTDTSTNGPTNWHWDFGDGVISTGKNPVHTYTAPDTYTVSLEALNGDGGGKETKIGYVRVAERPRIVLVPDSVSVTDRGQIPVRVLLDAVPFGLSGYRVKLSLKDGSRANFTGPVGFPLGLQPIDPTDDLGRNATITFKAADIHHIVEAGATAIPLGTVAITGERVGSTALEATVDLVTDDGGRSPMLESVTVPVEVVPGPVLLPGGYLPRDLDDDGLYEDVNGNGRLDFNDVVVLFDKLDWLSDYPEYTAFFDFNRNVRTDYADVVGLFNRL